VPSSNPLREALAAGRFCYLVELVASRLAREARLLEIASGLARVPGVVAGSVTSYAGGAPGHDPLRIATAARARGLAPNIHLTCVSLDRHGLRKLLEDIAALGIENVFAMSGDWPTAPVGQDRPPAVYDLDSVQLVSLIDEMRRAGTPFHVAVAVSPFKYLESDCLYQYLKLEKKAAAGADCAITQVGWDAAKFQELRRYVEERGLGLPLVGNVYVLGPRAAAKMARGEPPGCWVSPELREIVERESAGPDGGLGARLERAARTVAVLRGLGYAGAYIGGTQDPDQIARIIRRAEELLPRWEQLAEELRFGRRDGFYLYGREGVGPPPRRRRDAIPLALDTLGRLFPVRRESSLRRALRALFGAIDRSPVLARALERIEFAIKRPLFGCEACGNCVLGDLEYVCPMTCPKHERNGPCGGAAHGRCEVEDKPCIWGLVYERARAAKRIDALRVYVPPPNAGLRGTSSWISYFLDRDARPRVLAGDRTAPSEASPGRGCAGARARSRDAPGP
jgi:methylenetetrahydrofolate reductase (NADPH)